MFLNLLVRMSSLALLGLLAVVLVGPVVAVVGVLLPFAVIGLVVLGMHRGIRRLIHGRARAEKRRIPLDVKVQLKPQRPPNPAPEPALCAEPAPAVLRWSRPRRLLARLRNGVSSAGRTVFEVVCATAVGTLLGFLAGWQSGSLEEYTAVGAIAGAFFGVVVSGTKSEPRQRTQVAA
jgi:hypothetical protein